MWVCLLDIEGTRMSVRSVSLGSEVVKHSSGNAEGPGSKPAKAWHEEPASE